MLLKRNILYGIRAGVLSLVLWGLTPGSAGAQTYQMADGASWATCTGTFFDSGGSFGNYGDNESMVATLCPAGGPGTSPPSSITFTSWAVQAGAGDTLFIYNGTTTAAPVLAMGTGSQSLNGQSFVASGASGCLTFRWVSNATGNAAGWSATIDSGPDAGTNGTTTVCGNAAAFGLFSLLGGTPDPGGQWTLNGNLVSATYTPGTSAPGTYTYTVPGVPPCADATATVEVIEVAPPNAGASRSITVCSADAPFSMRSQLLGSPQAGGTWTGPGGAHSDTFNPAVDVSGPYVYQVNGTAPCANATATLTITVRSAPNAGTNGNITVCSTDAIFDLFTVLNGTPDVGGTWTAAGNVPHSNQFQPGTDAAGVYTYRVAGQAPCADATATVTVTVRTAPNAGSSASKTVCSNGATFSLLALLGPGASTTGTWTGPSTVTNNQYVPASMDPGIYTYTVTGQAPCANATATVNVTEIEAPEAGNNGTKTVCSTGATVDLFTRLGGTPDAGGAWTDPSNAPFPSGLYVPGTSTPGVYTYTVTGTTPCANDVATVTITQVQAPNAGTNGAVTLCSNSVPETLFVHLGGGAQAGGSWFKPNGTTFAGIYNPTNPGHPTGVYSYVVAGTAPCPNDTSTVTVTENQAPNAGTDGTLTFCSTGAQANLITGLTGSPNGSGSWLNPSNQPYPSGVFNPATGTPGVYKYIVPGLAPCANDTGFVTVVVHQAPNAGTNGSTTVCSNAAPFALSTVLGGSPNGGGTWSPGNGTYTPGTSTPGVYTYTVNGIAPCLNATATVTVDQERLPVAGTNGSVTVCSTEPPLNLFSRLGGTPDAGGTWTPGASNGVYTPGTSTPGTYTYTVAGVSPCPNVSATVAVTQNQAPNPGVGGTITVCSGSVTVDLFTGLTGSPDAGGTWSAVGNIAPGVLVGSNFLTLAAPPGDYHFRYDLPGSGQCPPAHSNVEVEIVSQLHAGSNGSGSACHNNTHYNLFSALGSNPQQGGNWVDLDATGQVSGQFFNASGVSPGVYHFRYRLTGSISCASDSATATVTVVQEAFAGDDVSFPICSSSGPVNLFTLLTGAQSGGQWRRQGGGGFSGIYDCGANDSGVYLYIVQGSSPCGPDTARVTVTEYQAANAGTSNTITVCATGSQFNMTSQLLGTPATNGSWVTPGAQGHSNTFVPGVDPAGTYSYTVAGAGICPAVTTQLTVNVNDPADAGLDGAKVVCSTSSDFLLITTLNGTPEQVGTWTGPGGVAIPNGIYSPVNMDPGVFTYVVAGDAPCPNDTAHVEIFENEAADAGTSTSVQLCANSGAVDLVTLLGGTPDPTGTWTAPGGGSFPGTFVPGSSTVGTYTYTVAGVAPCTNASASVTVAVVNPPNAGQSRSISVCTSASPFSLVSRLGGSPALNGSWTLLGQPADGFFIPSTTTPGVYVYTYTVSGTGPCGSATATLTITLNLAANAGGNGQVTLCSTSGATLLFQYLTGSPQTGGTWTKPGGAAHSGTFLPGTDPPGVYTYCVSGTAPCTTACATVTVSVNQAPNAGNNALRIVCGDGASFLLLNVLTGNPNLGGSWTGPGGPSNGIYVPGTDQPGVYTYVVNGGSVCASASAQVQIIENDPAHAGTDAVWSVCSDQAQSALLTHLGGSPDNNGSWLDPGGQPFTGIFIPASSVDGIYTYVVAGVAPCANDTARLTVVKHIAPDAGANSAPLICTSSAPVQLVDLLGGTPNGGGTWTGPGGGHDAVFHPSTDPPGAYNYVVTGIAPCVNDMSTVQIQLVGAPNAGDDGALSTCTGDPGLNLFAGLVGQPQTGGTWNDNDGTGAMSQAGIFNATAVPQGTFHFTYTVNGTGSCGSDSAMVTVTVSPSLDAGADASTELCLGTTVNLLNYLGGTPQNGGIWRDQDHTNALTGNQFNATLAGAGTFHFEYVLNGSANCMGDSSALVVTVVPGPNAGQPGSQTFCSNANQVSLGSLLVGPHDNTGSWFDPSLAPHGSVFHPSSDPQGVYTYIVPGSGNCVADTSQVTITVTQAPNAGSPGGSLTVCSNGNTVDLFPHLNGTPQTGGSWTYLGFPHASSYTPPVDAPGAYIYTVQGSGVCANAQASVVVSENPAPFAGLDNAVSACSSDGVFNLFSQLSGSPQSGGSWTDPHGNPHSVNFDPTTDSSGVYTYTVSGAPPCAADQATITVTLTYAPDAGIDSTLSVCATLDQVDLFPALGLAADTGGTWTDVNGTGALTGSVLTLTGLSLGTYTFGYTLPGSGPCAGDAATITVQIVEGLEPGEGGDIDICGGYAAYDLITLLTGSPSPGGVWSDIAGTGALSGGTLNATLLTPGATYQFGYTVHDPACGDASALLSLTVADYPDPGADTAIAICSSAASFDLFTMLAGTPDTGGSWTRTDGTPVSNIFHPGTDPSGTYHYNLSGTAPCADTSAAVTVQVNAPPNAGPDALVQRCNNGTYDLTNALGPDAQPGGTWTDVGGTGALAGSLLTLDGLATGEHPFDYTVQVAGCGTDQARITMRVVDGVSVTDTVLTCDEVHRTYSITLVLDGGDPTTYYVSGVPGTISLQQPATYVFTSEPLFTSQGYSLTVDDSSHCTPRVIEGATPCVFSDDVFVPESFTPNGDNANDLFVIPGIEGFPGNHIVIFNRWGGQVYEADGYDNHNVVWDGTAKDALIPGVLPTGTYYYVLELGNSTPALKGFVYLNR